MCYERVTGSDIIYYNNINEKRQLCICQLLLLNIQLCNFSLHAQESGTNYETQTPISLSHFFVPLFEAFIIALVFSNVI
jgi:hypothetical protein